MNLSQLDADEARFIARIEDLVRMADTSGRSQFSHFLTERQTLLVQELMRQRESTGCLIFGGFDGSTRCVLGVFADHQVPDIDLFPIETITLHLPAQASVTHRDVLGSLMALQIKREAIGDILVAERLCHVFVLKSVALPIVEELKKIGRTGIRCELGQVGELSATHTYQEIFGTIPSPRLDALVSLLTGLAREKSAQLIRNDLVRQNDRPIQNISREIVPGDIISIRGYGKFAVDEIGQPTRKGRLPLVCRKYI